jgi:hypothetical protein
LVKEEMVLGGLLAAAVAAVDFTAVAAAGITMAAAAAPRMLGVSMEEQLLQAYKTVTARLLFLGMHRVVHHP